MYSVKIQVSVSHPTTTQEPTNTSSALSLPQLNQEIERTGEEGGGITNNNQLEILKTHLSTEFLAMI